MYLDLLKDLLRVLLCSFQSTVFLINTSTMAIKSQFGYLIIFEFRVHIIEKASFFVFLFNLALVQNWLCEPERVFITHLPETDEIFSYGSGYNIC